MTLSLETVYADAAETTLDAEQLRLICEYWHGLLKLEDRKAFIKVREQVERLAQSPAYLRELVGLVTQENAAKAKEQARLSLVHRFAEGAAIVYARASGAHNGDLQSLEGRVARVSRCIPNKELTDGEAAPSYGIDFGWEAYYLVGMRYWRIAEKWLAEGDPTDLPPRLVLPRFWGETDPWGKKPLLTPEQIAELVKQFDLPVKARLEWKQNLVSENTGRTKVKNLMRDGRVLRLKGMTWPILIQVMP